MCAKFLYIGTMLSGLIAAQVPLEQEPRHHLEFANEWLRVISPQIPPGDTTLEHLHTMMTPLYVSTARRFGQNNPAPNGAMRAQPACRAEPGSLNILECLARIRCRTSARMCTTCYWWKIYGKVGGRRTSLSLLRA